MPTPTLDDARRALIERTPLACPLCAMSAGPGTRGRAVVLVAVDAGPAADRRQCPSCRLVVSLPRAPLAAAIKRAGRA